jgi:dihydrofolate synthase / folylpolyglutamate synthase
MRFQRLQDWLQWQEQLHPREIDLGLERVAVVASRLGIDHPKSRVITVAGTNGKGSSLAMLEKIYLEAGYQTGLYTSPHLFAYNERIRINGASIDDESLCQAFEAIDQARGDISLSYFEFGTLAALWCFNHHELDIILLEVGLGGRLDAVNIIDPDVALITTVDVDHTDWLGSDRETIGLEKAGIMRRGRAAVVSEPDPPQSVSRYARKLGADLMCLEKDFRYETGRSDWSWICHDQVMAALPFPGLSGEFQFDNASGVLAAIKVLQPILPVDIEAIAKGLKSVSIPGRLMEIQKEPRVLLDVAHNVQGARALAGYLKAQPVNGRTHIVIGVMADKDIAGMLRYLCDQADHWYVCRPEISRAMPADQLGSLVREICETEVIRHNSVADAFQHALNSAAENDQIIVMGSFFTVAEAWSDQYNAEV